MKFIDKVENIYGMYGSDIWNFCKKYIRTELFKTNNNYVKTIDIKNIKPGELYYIKYNNGGISLHKFVLCVELAKTLNKNGKLLAWCINIGDMTLDSRTAFFAKFFDSQIEKNINTDKVEEEPSFNMKVNTLYQYLKSQNYNYIIEPYNILNIKELKRISTNVLEYFIFYISSEDNYNILEQSLINLNEQSGMGDLKQKIRELLKKYKELLEQYQDNSKEFHKILKNFETNLKLFDQ